MQARELILGIFNAAPQASGAFPHSGVDFLAACLARWSGLGREMLVHWT